MREISPGISTTGSWEQGDQVPRCLCCELCGTGATTVCVLLRCFCYYSLCLCRGDDKNDICGLVLVKEMLQFWRAETPPTVDQLDLRHMPRIPADTPMFDVLRLFQVCGNVRGMHDCICQLPLTYAIICLTMAVSSYLAYVGAPAQERCNTTHTSHLAAAAAFSMLSCCYRLATATWHY